MSQSSTAPAKMLISSTFSSKPRGVYWVVPGSSGTLAVSPKSFSNLAGVGPERNLRELAQKRGNRFFKVLNFLYHLRSLDIGLRHRRQPDAYSAK